MITRAVIINNRYHVPLTTYMSPYVKHGITYSTVELFNDSKHFFVCEIPSLLTFQNISLCLQGIYDFISLLHTIFDIKLCYFHTQL